MLPDTALLQLMFAQLNNECFGGEIPTHRIAYNARFANVAGRITYKPPLIELSPKHFASRPEALRETLLHEMIHAWLFSRGENPGHTPAFKRKMRELGMASIYHDMGSATPRARKHAPVHPALRPLHDGGAAQAPSCCERLVRPLQRPAFRRALCAARLRGRRNQRGRAGATARRPPPSSIGYRSHEERRSRVFARTPS